MKGFLQDSQLEGSMLRRSGFQMRFFDEAELLWKSYVVVYFNEEAPHVGLIHATVNRI